MSSILPIGPAARVAGPYTATEGQTSFPYAFALIDRGDLLVETAPAFAPDTWTPATLDLHYTLSPAPPVSAGGNVVFLAGRGAGARVRISGQAVIANTTDPLPGGQVDSKQLNRFFDRVTIWAQEAWQRYVSDLGYVDGLDAQNVKLTGAQSVAGTKDFSDARVAEPLHANSAVTKAYVDAKALDDGGGLDPATAEETADGTGNVSGITPLRLLGRLKSDGFLSAKHFWVKLNGTDESTGWDLTLAEAVPLKVPAGTHPIYAPLTIRAGGGVFGDGEKTVLQRRFNGGALLRHPGYGNVPGTPIILRDIRIDKHASITPVNGDHGVDIGYATYWAQRGDIENLYITGQWVGFQAKGGSEGPMKNIYAVENWSHGFNLINPRGRLVRGLAVLNGKAFSGAHGDGFHIHSDTLGETGFVLEGCGTYCNYGYGYIVAGTAACANVWGFANHNSFDRLGGVRVGDQALTQFVWRSAFIEYSGFSGNQNALYPNVAGAPGILIGAGVNVADLSGLQILNNSGAGLSISGAHKVTARDVTTRGNTQIGLAIGATSTDIDVSGVASQGNGQWDIYVEAGATGCLFDARADYTKIFLPPSTGFVTGNVTPIPPTVQAIASASTIALPGYGDVFAITGTTQIDTIQGSWNGRRVTLLFGGNITVIDGNNQSLPGNFVAASGGALNLVCHAGRWYAASAGVNNG